MKIVGMLCVKNEARWIERVLAAQSFCDHILLMDDHSTDDTVRIAQQFANVEILPSPFDDYQEGRNNTWLAAQVALLEPDWVVHCMGDEVLEQDTWEKIQGLIVDPNVNVIRFRVVNFWDGIYKARVDGHWGKRAAHAMWRFPKGVNLTYYSMHCGLPEQVEANMHPHPDEPQPVSLCLFHYGYSSPELRQEAYDFFVSRDKDPSRLAGYKALLEESEVVLEAVPWEAVSHNPVKHNLDAEVTVLVASSPILSHPSINILEETLASIRFHFPEAKIVVMLDGLREEQVAWREQYEEYKRRVAWSCENVWKNTMALSFDQHSHQSGMTRCALEFIITPLVLFVEHDTPLCTKEIPWEELAGMITWGDCNLVRFPPDAETAKEFAMQPYHTHLMLDKQGVWRNSIGAPVIRTVQWSQRPHLVSSDFYRRVLRENFSENSRAFIEIVLAHPVGTAPWEDYKLVIYAPPVGSIRRSYHLNGRSTAPHFNESQIL